MNKPAESPVPVADAEEAKQATDNLNRIMDRLEAALEEEIAHARAGKLFAAADMDAAKVELTRAYAAESERVKAARDLIAQSLPETLDALQRRHEALRDLLQTNLTVLATAHAVSEGIIRGVSAELARKRAPATYGASGRATAPDVKTSQPMALSRTL